MFELERVGSLPKWSTISLHASIRDFAYLSGIKQWGRIESTGIAYHFRDQMNKLIEENENVKSTNDFKTTWVGTLKD